jgi:O-antigen/teichoic acid export membrane protein
MSVRAGTSLIVRLACSQTLRDLFFFGAGGVAFAAAGLVFARILTVDQYALLTLLVALATLGFALGPVGLDGVALREQRALPTPLIVAVAAVVGLVLAVAGAAIYSIPAPLVVALWIAAAAGAATFVASAHCRCQERFGLAIALTQMPNVLLLAATAICLALGNRSAALAFTVVTLGLVLVAAVSLARSDRRARLPARLVPWREALALGGASVATMLLIQLERLTIPQLLPLADLALFGVLGAFAGSLFRILQTGVGFSLLPKLRAAGTVLERRRLVAHEAGLAVAIAIGGSLAVLALAPAVESFVLAGKYDLAPSLLVATILSGAAKIMDSFARTLGTALASARELMWINLLGFVAVGLAFAGAVVGARFGLVGLIYGVAAAWQFRAVAAFVIVAKHLREPERVPATASG